MLLPPSTLYMPSSLAASGGYLYAREVAPVISPHTTLIKIDVYRVLMEDAGSMDQNDPQAHHRAHFFPICLEHVCSLLYQH